MIDSESKDIMIKVSLDSPPIEGEQTVDAKLGEDGFRLSKVPGDSPAAKELSTLTAAVLAQRSIKEAADAELKLANKALKEAEFTLLERMRLLGTDGVTMHGYGFAKVSKMTAKKVDEQVLFDWLIAHGYESVVKPTVNHMTLNKIVKEVIEEEGTAVPGVELSEFDILQIRRK